MTHKRVGIILGAQSGLAETIQFCEGVKQGTITVGSGGSLAKGRLSDTEILSVLTQVALFERALHEGGIQIFWTTLGADAQFELPMLGKALDLNLSANQDVFKFEDFQQADLDMLIYLPLDVLQSKQVEQLARLSMIMPRVKHVCFASPPRWDHSQLMALKETWDWIDPRQRTRLHNFINEVMEECGVQDFAGVDMLREQQDMVEPLFVTQSVIMREVLALSDAVADSDSTVLITGESGTGKEIVAQRIHARSHRRRNPLVALNCGAIPGELLESELFGHVKGAFTGANNNRIGRFEAAHNGTLFLDEIGELPINLQVKLLRVLQERRFEPVGSTVSKQVNVRIVAATNRDLEEEVKRGRFREDLFYRLNVIPVYVPPMRERPEDVELLVEHFIRKFNMEKARRVTGITRAAIRSLAAYEWPGNVRELENLIERMVILKTSGMIDVLDFPEKFRRQTYSEIEYSDLINNVRHGGERDTLAKAIELETSKEMGESMRVPGSFNKLTINQSVSAGQSQESAQGSIGAVNEQDNASYRAQGSITIQEAMELIEQRVAFPVDGMDFNHIVDHFENILILRSLERTGWNRNRAAALLKLNRTTLVEKLKKKQLSPTNSQGIATQGQRPVQQNVTSSNVFGVSSINNNTREI